MKNIIVYGIAVLIFFCVGCQSREPEMHFEQEQSFVLRIYVGGKPVREATILTSSEKVRPIRSILQEKKDHWKGDFADYAPVLLMKGANFNVNFQSVRVIVNCKNSAGKWEQFVSALSPEEYKIVKSIFDACTATSKGVGS